MRGPAEGSEPADTRQPANQADNPRWMYGPEEALLPLIVIEENQ
jgi:hypothetical protein